MNIVITMAGAGSRFQKAGYKQPKYMIEAKGKTLFEWSMMSLTAFIGRSDAKFFFVVKKADDSRDFIEKHCAALGIDSYTIIEIERLTDGQATSAMLAENYWEEDEELIVYNIDTYVEPGEIKVEDFCGDGFIPCFKASGDHWSFAKLDDSGRVIEVREKQRISDNCTIGLYYFKSAKLYKKIYDEYYSDDANLEKNEKYIAPLYNYMIAKGMEVRISDIPVHAVHVLGTPDEVEVFKNS